MLPYVKRVLAWDYAQYSQYVTMVLVVCMICECATVVTVQGVWPRAGSIVAVLFLLVC